MKTLKHIFSLLLLITVIIGCTDDDNETNFVNNIPAPTNVSLLATVTPDNTGLVTLTPLGEGVANFQINYGDGSGTSEVLNPGESTQHIYEEGSYDVVVVATGITGQSTTAVQTIQVSFLAPQNLEVTIENDTAVSRQVNVTATADLAMNYEVDFGVAGAAPLMGNIGETVSYVYETAGTYTITVTAFSAAIETTIYTEEFVVTEILQPLASAPTPPTRSEDDVISMFSNTYQLDVAVSSWRADWSTSTLTDLQIDGNDTKFYADADFVGVEFYGDAAVDASDMEFFHLDFWTANATTFRVKLVDLGGTATEAEIVFDDLAQNEWVSLEIPMSAFTDAGMTATNSIQQLIFSGLPTGTFDFFIDNVYFYKSPSSPAAIAGTWKLAPENGALGVGPAIGDVSWYACNDDCITERACYYDDTYVFGSDGSFMNVLGAETFIEGWQGGSDACGTPVAPHDGSNPATFTYNEASGALTVSGTGAYIGLPKANNEGELPNVAVPNSITYTVTALTNDTMEMYIEAGAGVFWQYKLIREGEAPSPLTGTWQMAAENGALGVGPAVGDVSWYACNDDCITDRACYYDDTYVFGSDGSFMNVLGAETFIEGWQGGSDTCGTPVAPHDGSNPATYTYDAESGTVTINGVGSYIGLPKANNQGELPNVAVPDSITYNVTLVDSNTMQVYIEAGSGVFWQYKLVKL
ncbi:hypothetical protein [Psychroserpens sp. SPM9]|uniref:hypothetical protein n=1 Tax=Psychroserpens sp. SPM9 TaxID=2975598 RepID=UPI0021A543C7|nr:hypothetical protein [Psychroserpens sp. SPM9]MDG5491340.1 hypothetical protein [Psychroserpens sp. SPM9]